MERFAFTPMGTFGRLIIDDQNHWYTVEEEWRHNVPGKQSCIPEGDYELRYDYYHKGEYAAYLVVGPGVGPERRILIHAANTTKDIEGCIGPGLTLGCMHGQWAVVDSRTALGLFMKAMNKENGTLRVVNLVFSWRPDVHL